MNYRQINIAITIGIAMMLLVITLGGFFGLHQLQKLDDTRYSLKLTNHVLLNLRSVYEILQDAETGQRGYLITGRESYLEPYKNSLIRMNELIQHLQQLAVDNPDEKQDILTLENAINKKFSELKKTIEVRNTQGFAAAYKLVLTDIGNHQMEIIRDTLARMLEREHNHLIEHNEEQNVQTNNTFLWIFILCGIAIFFQIVMGLVTLSFLKAQNVAQKALKESDERFRLMLSGVRDYAIFMLDPEGKIITWNEGAQRIKGYTDKEIIGKHFSIFYSEEERAENKPAHELEIALKAGLYEEEGQRIRKDGSKFWANVIIRPLYSESGHLIGFVKVTRDITLNKLAEQKQIALAEMKQVNAELEEFASVASHDLQEPLRAIAGCLQILERTYKGKLDANADELIHYAVDGALRMRTLINNLLALSRVSNSKVVLTSVDLSEILTQVLKNMETTIKEAGAVITHDQLPVITAEKTQLTQLFQNLISNAIKFCRDEPPQIHIGITGDEHKWQICVSDNGIGFEKEQAESLFQPFKRLHTREKYPGTGIGLVICKRIVEKHGGTIWAESEPSKGAKFCFTLVDK